MCCVAHAATAHKPMDVALVVKVLNILMSADRVRDMYHLRMMCRMTRRRSFPVPDYLLIELLPKLMGEILVGHGSSVVSFVFVLRAIILAQPSS